MALVESYWLNTKESSLLIICWLTECDGYCLLITLTYIGNLSEWI